MSQCAQAGAFSKSCSALEVREGPHELSFASTAVGPAAVFEFPSDAGVAASVSEPIRKLLISAAKSHAPLQARRSS